MAFLKMAIITKNGVAGRRLRDNVQQGIEQLDRGRARAFDTRTINRIKRVGRKKLATAKGKAGRY